MPIALAKAHAAPMWSMWRRSFSAARWASIAAVPSISPRSSPGIMSGVWLDGWESSFYAWLGRLGLSYFATGGGVTIVRQGTDAEIFMENEVDCFTSTTYRAPFGGGRRCGEGKEPDAPSLSGS